MSIESTSHQGIPNPPKGILRKPGKNSTQYRLTPVEQDKVDKLTLQFEKCLDALEKAENHEKLLSSQINRLYIKLHRLEGDPNYSLHKEQENIFKQAWGLELDRIKVLTDEIKKLSEEMRVIKKQKTVSFSKNLVERPKNKKYRKE